MNPVKDDPAGQDNPNMFEDEADNPGPGGHGRKSWLWQGKIVPAFWTVSSFLSLTVNIILIIIIVVLVQELFVLKDLVNGQLLGGLYENFVKMDNASIVTTVYVDDEIIVNDTIPVVFILPLEKNTIVTLTERVSIPNTTVFLNGSPINTNIILPAGTELPVFLNIDVPVNQTIPISITVPIHLEVPVTIPLNETELHEPFTGLQDVVGPYYSLIGDTPNSWEEAACKAGPLLCKLFGGNN